MTNLPIIDTLLAAALTAGVALSLPLWWWLFLAPLIKLCRGGKGLSRYREQSPGASGEVAHQNGRAASGTCAASVRSASAS